MNDQSLPLDTDDVLTSVIRDYSRKFDELLIRANIRAEIFSDTSKRIDRGLIRCFSNLLSEQQELALHRPASVLFARAERFIRQCEEFERHTKKLKSSGAIHYASELRDIHAECRVAIDLTQALLACKRHIDAGDASKVQMILPASA